MLFEKGLVELLCVCLTAMFYLLLMGPTFVFFLLAVVWWTNKFISRSFQRIRIDTSIWAFTKSRVQLEMRTGERSGGGDRQSMLHNRNKTPRHKSHFTATLNLTSEITYSIIPDSLKNTFRSEQCRSYFVRPHFRVLTIQFGKARCVFRTNFYSYQIQLVVTKHDNTI